MSTRAEIRARRRAQLVAGMRRALAERGYEGATVAAIAGHAGLAPGLAHYHFPSKQAILLALIEELVADARRRFQARAAELTDPWDRLDAFIEALTALEPGADPSGAICWARVGAEAQRLPEVGALYAAALSEAHAALRALARAIDPGADAPEVAAGLLVAIEGAFRLGVGAPTLLPAGHAASLVKRMARGLLAPR